MAEPLKNQYGMPVVREIGASIECVYPKFATDKYIQQVQQGFSRLELMDRGRKIASALKTFLPDNFESATDILVASLDALIERDETGSISSFIYLPHTIYVAEYGLHSFTTSTNALYQLTQRFTAEFAIRPFIQTYPDKTLALLTKWAIDPNYHVRRLVSEGTRTRLPWASRLPAFIEDPSAVINLLELLKDDPELYVRRSVANNLNDIGKDHPHLLADIAKRWLKDASKDREWLVKHALRSAIKRGEQGALDALGYGQTFSGKITNVVISPATPKIGDAVTISFDVTNLAKNTASLMIDFSIYFVKASGHPKPKVFKLKAVELAAKHTQNFSKKVSLKPMTTRTLYLGVHQVDVIINGENFTLGEFTLSSER